MKDSHKTLLTGESQEGVLEEARHKFDFQRSRSLYQVQEIKAGEAILGRKWHRCLLRVMDGLIREVMSSFKGL